MEKKIKLPVEGDLKVWWVPQIPMKAFCVKVKTPQEAKKLLNVLAKYDKFQYDNRIKPDYCNAGGLMEYHDGEWEDWYNEDGYCIDGVEFED